MEAFGDTLLTAIQTESVTFLTSFIGTYWSVLLTIGAVLFVGRWFLRLTGIAR